MGRVVKVAAGIALVGFGSAACGGDDEVAELRVVTSAGGTEYTFEIPDRIGAGPTRVALANGGDEAHHAQLFKLDDGATVADLGEALATGDPAAALEVGTFLGGTALVSPGEESRAEAIVDLSAGDYALICVVEDRDGTPHVAHGMLRPFTVTDSGAPASPPEADLEVALSDYRFELPERIPGDAVLAVTNAAEAEPHEMVVARLDEGATADAVSEALDQRRPLPATALGGVQAILPGTTQRLELDLEPGRYVVICVVTSPDGTPHHRKGMIEEVTIT